MAVVAGGQQYADFMEVLELFTVSDLERLVRVKLDENLSDMYSQNGTARDARWGLIQWAVRNHREDKLVRAVYEERKDVPRVAMFYHTHTRTATGWLSDLEKRLNQIDIPDFDAAVWRKEILDRFPGWEVSPEAELRTPVEVMNNLARTPGGTVPPSPGLPLLLFVDKLTRRAPAAGDPEVAGTLGEWQSLAARGVLHDAGPPVVELREVLPGRAKYFAGAVFVVMAAGTLVLGFLAATYASRLETSERAHTENLKSVTDAHDKEVESLRDSAQRQMEYIGRIPFEELTAALAKKDVSNPKLKRGDAVVVGGKVEEKRTSPLHPMPSLVLSSGRGASVQRLLVYLKKGVTQVPDLVERVVIVAGRIDAAPNNSGEWVVVDAEVRVIAELK